MGFPKVNSRFCTETRLPVAPNCLDQYEGQIGADFGNYDFKMSIVSTFKDPMSRQVAESTRVRKLEDQDRRGEAICLNSRLDWVKTAGVNLVPTIGVLKQTPAS